MIAARAPVAARGRAESLAAWIGIGSVALLGIPLVFHAFFSGFQEYDDEGYVLISIREYLRGGGLYDQVYSQYGPAYYQIVGGLFRLLRLPVTHTSGRALAMALVVVTAAVCGLATWRLSRSLVLAASTQLLVLQTLLPSRNEPLHPGTVLALALAVLVLAGSFLDSRHGRLAAVVIGGLVAIMLLIKINVGGFAAVATAFALLAASPGRRGWLRLAAALFVLVPLALMLPHADDPAIRIYMGVTVAAAVAVVLVGLRHSGESLTASHALPVMAGTGAVVAILVCGWELLRGTTPGGLLDGVLVGPSRHPGLVFVTPDLPPASVAWALLGLGAALAFRRATRGGVIEQPGWDLGLGVGQLLAGAALWLAAANRLPLGPLAVSPPLLWAALVRSPHPEEVRGPLGANLLVAVATLQTLHAYPMAGTQVAWGVFLAIPVGAIVLAEGWRRTTAALALPAVAGRFHRRVAGITLGAGLLALTASGFYATHRAFEADYAQAVPLGLPGAEAIRVDPEQAALLRFLVGTLSARCRTFVTQPGFNSLYFFTGMEPPTQLNTNLWMLLLRDAQQQRIVERLARAATPVCALRRQRRIFRTPLARYIDERFVTIFRVETFEFMVRR